MNFQELSTAVGLADEILIVGYDEDGTDIVHTLQSRPYMWKRKLKFDKDKFHFRCASIPFIRELISRYGEECDPH